RLEVVGERERRAIPVVARPEGVPEAEVRLLLDVADRSAGDRLVGEEVVVHRDDAIRVADERDLEQRQLPDAEAAVRPRAEDALAARVVAEAARGEHRQERTR